MKGGKYTKTPAKILVEGMGGGLYPEGGGMYPGGGGLYPPYGGC